MTQTSTRQSSDGSEPGAALRFGRMPGAWPLVGHVVALQRRPLRFLDRLAGCGDLVQIRIGTRRVFVLCDPGLAHQVLADLRTFDRTGVFYDRVRDAMGNGLATAVYADHRRQRLIMQPAFRHEHLRGYAEVMREQIVAAMDGWQDGMRIDIVGEMFKLTMSVALRALFSSQIDTRETAELRAAFDVFLRGTALRIALPGFRRLPVPGSRRYAAALESWSRQVRALVQNCRRAETGSCATAGGVDLMSRLLAAHDDEGFGMTDEELADQVAVLLLAGGETTSSALVWSMYLLCEHPQIMEALHTEVDAVLGRRTAVWEDLPRLDLTARVVREALRLYPPAWIITRTATRTTQLAGRRIPAGALLLFCPYVVQRRPDVYPQPDRFDPDRWLAPHDRSGAGVPRGAYLPFGAGAAKCIGEDFGMVEATLALASITARWQVEREPDAAISPSARLVFAPRSLPVRLVRRY